MTYLLTWTKNSVTLIGPFDSEAEAGNWAEGQWDDETETEILNPNNPNDNPCWQVINLSIPAGVVTCAVPIRSPDSGPLPAYT